MVVNASTLHLGLKTVTDHKIFFFVIVLCECEK
jgi:hypothetical protein